jgi:hypothetical protein
MIGAFERRKTAYQALVEKHAGRPNPVLPAEAGDPSEVSIADDGAGTRVSVDE